MTMSNDRTSRRGALILGGAGLLLMTLVTGASRLLNLGLGRIGISASVREPRQHTGGNRPSMPDQRSINPWGLRLSGAKRVEDCWSPALAGLPTDGRARVTGDCTQHIVRGGNEDRVTSLRSAHRGSAVPGTVGIGFHVVSTLVDR
jgi:hypothetical protein